MDLNAKIAKKKQLKDAKLANKFGIVLESVNLWIGKFTNLIAKYFNNNKKTKNKKNHKKKEEESQKLIVKILTRIKFK